MLPRMERHRAGMCSDPLPIRSTSKLPVPFQASKLNERFPSRPCLSRFLSQPESSSLWTSIPLGFSRRISEIFSTVASSVL
jgi:hypothetical protein